MLHQCEVLNHSAGRAAGEKARNLTRLTKNVVLTLLLVAGLAAGAAAQAPRPNVFDGGNRWLLTGFFNCAPNHAQAATQGICFLPYAQSGSCIVGIWYSDTYPNWGGRYSQEGDRVRMHGNWGNDIGSDGMVIDLFAGTSPRDVGAGAWTEWLNAGPFGMTVAFGNARLRRAGKCDLPPNFDAARVQQGELEKAAEGLSRRVRPRLRRDGKPAESPADPEQVPLPEERDYEPRK